jgi:tetratricopeptide (TPR) repeat protein
MADIDAALKLEPASVEALYAKVELQQHTGKFADALTTLNLVHGHGFEPMVLARRGILEMKLGNAAVADKDFADARALAKTADMLNNLCWEKATAGVALDRALAECDAGLALTPDASEIVDSRGFTLLRLGRLDESITAYDRALLKRPTQASSLYGRAVAEARKGEKSQAETDLEAALKADPDIRTEFDDFGVTISGAERVKTS